MSACDRCLRDSAGTLAHRRVPRQGDRVAAIDAGLLRRHCAETGIAIECRCAPGYPPALRQLSDSPPVLYARGDESLLTRCPAEAIAIVGTRRPTVVGREAARRIGAGIGRSGGVVVSGMALGVDGAAHDGALGVHAPTVAVLAGGVDRATPPSHRQLYDRILDRGVVVSELPPGARPTKWSFPARNRIIAALSCATVVVEAPRRSGALITVEHALDLGREVYAVPGSLASDTCEGSNQLLCDGSGAVIDGAALAARLGLQNESLTSRPQPGPQAIVWDVLMRGPVSGPEIAGQATGISPDEAEIALLDLELGGWIERAPNGTYRALQPGLY